MVTIQKKGVTSLRKPFQTTIEKELIDKLKFEAIKQGINVNDILEKLIEMYLSGKIKLNEKEA